MGIVIGTPLCGNASGMLVNFSWIAAGPFISFSIPRSRKAALSPVEEKALLQDNTCLQIWKENLMRNCLYGRRGHASGPINAT